MTAYVVREGSESCPVGCGEFVFLIKCLPSGRLVGWCGSCEVSLPIPLPNEYGLSKTDIDPRRYAPGGVELPTRAEVEEAGLAPHVLRTITADDWYGFSFFRTLQDGYGPHSK